MFPVFVEHLGKFLKRKYLKNHFLSVDEQSLGIFKGHIFLEKRGSSLVYCP